MVKATRTQVASAINAIKELMPASTPSAVATPLPPLKRRKTLKTWPNSAHSPASAASPALNPSIAASHTANQPFAQSPASVTIAAALLPLRSTLVAPGFPEPYLRGSSRPNSRLDRIANGTEPMR